MLIFFEKVKRHARRKSVFFAIVLASPWGAEGSKEMEL
jgi:hypothetical protein